MRRAITKAVVLAACLALAPGWYGARAQAEVPDSAYAEVNASLLDHHIMVGYARLASTTEALAETASEYCAGGVELDPLRAAYHAAMDAWMAIQHIRFGPVELYMRSYRL